MSLHTRECAELLLNAVAHEIAESVEQEDYASRAALVPIYRWLKEKAKPAETPAPLRAPGDGEQSHRA